MKHLALIAALAALAMPAMAHESPTGWKYPALCCSNRDCRDVADEMVSVTPSGLVMTLPAGYHNMVPEGGRFLIDQSKIQPSPDGLWHVCIAPSTQKILCVFGPPFGT